MVLQLEEFKKRKAAAAAKKAGTPSLTPQTTPLVTPIKGPDSNSTAPPLAASAKATSQSARRALPAPQAERPSQAVPHHHDHQAQPTAGDSVQPEQVSKLPSAGKAATTPQRQAASPAPQVPPRQGNAPDQLAQSAAAAPAVQPTYQNGDSATSRPPPAAAPGAEQHSVHQLQQKLQEQEHYFGDQMQQMQRILADKEARLHALQSQAAAVEAGKESMSSELAQQKAEVEEDRQRLQHAALEHQRLSEARNLEWQSSNRSLQEQV